ncbi:MAG: DUF3379 domain-containing protein [Betaproteobacteria bacterium HGW-Betaproteobacteria-14]|nr:MAG: DUF3379 domain-containing protein [Betaproteobacteria bacterium HGW-Betaproteobacteria-14]
MNCLEFRRIKLAEPRRLPHEALAHMSECATCRGFAADINENEERLAATLAVPVPEGLAERIILRRKAGARVFAKASPRLWAMAATVVLTFAFGFQQWKNAGSQEYAKLAIQHVMHEPESFTTARLADPQLFRTVMQNFGGEMQASLGKVRYMKLCPVPEGTGWHIVFETEQGELATLILIPAKRMTSQSEQATVGGWTALARPGGQGYYAVIASSPDTLDKVDELLRQRVRWRS